MIMGQGYKPRSSFLICFGNSNFFQLSTLSLSPSLHIYVATQRKGMVSSRPEEEPLSLQVARGTNVYDDHEKAVIELCSTDADDADVEQCVVDYLSMESQGGEAAKRQGTQQQETECDLEDDDDADCMVGNMMDMWAADLPDLPPPPKDLDSAENPADKVIKPWSSRSSGSGTYVRDPVTGEMKNIDA